MLLDRIRRSSGQGWASTATHLHPLQIEVQQGHIASIGGQALQLNRVQERGRPAHTVHDFAGQCDIQALAALMSKNCLGRLSGRTPGCN